MTNQPVANSKAEWRHGDESTLRQLWGRIPVSTIATRLERSETAVIVRAKRLGLKTLVNHPDALPEWQIAAMMGLDRKTVWRLMRDGVLPVDIIYKRNLPCRVVWRDELERWVRNWRNWVYAPVEKIADQRLLRMARIAQQRWGDRWLSSGEAAALLGIDYRRLNAWTNRGVFHQAVRWGNWYYLHSEIVTVHEFVGRSWVQ